MKDVGENGPPCVPEAAMLPAGVDLQALRRPGAVPIRHQIVDVDGADAGGEVPAGSRAESRRIRAVRGREHAVGAGRIKAIGAIALARDVIVAERYVVEDAGASDRIPIARIAGCRCRIRWRQVGNSREFGLPWRLPRLLVHQCLDAGPDRRREGSAARATPVDGWAGTGCSAVSDVGPAKT